MHCIARYIFALYKASCTRCSQQCINEDIKLHFIIQTPTNEYIFIQDRQYHGRVRKKKKKKKKTYNLSHIDLTENLVCVN